MKNRKINQKKNTIEKRQELNNANMEVDYEHF